MFSFLFFYTIYRSKSYFFTEQRICQDYIQKGYWSKVDFQKNFKMKIPLLINLSQIIQKQINWPIKSYTT